MYNSFLKSQTISYLVSKLSPIQYHSMSTEIQSKNQNGEGQAYARIRKAIGYCGFAIPILCLVLSLSGRCNQIALPSISHYYYTIIGDVFVGVMFALGLFLVLYKSSFRIEKYRKQENLLTNISGVFAIIVGLIPTDPEGGDCFHINLFDGNYNDVFGFFGFFHLPAAALMLVIFGIISYRYFPRNWKTGIVDSTNKNRYRICAYIIFISIGILVLYFADGKFLKGRFLSGLSNIKIVFALECVAIMAFAVSWLQKGRAADSLSEMYNSVKRTFSK